MSDKDEPLVPSEKDIKAKMEDVKELYREADVVHGGFAESGDGVEKFAGKDDGVASDNARPQDSGVKASPRWVLEVLADMAALAKNEQWVELHACLEDAREKAVEVLDQMDGGRASHKSDDGEALSRR